MILYDVDVYDGMLMMADSDDDNYEFLWLCHTMFVDVNDDDYANYEDVV